MAALFPIRANKLRSSLAPPPLTPMTTIRPPMASTGRTASTPVAPTSSRQDVVRTVVGNVGGVDDLVGSEPGHITTAGARPHGGDDVGSRRVSQLHRHAVPTPPAAPEMEGMLPFSSVRCFRWRRGLMGVAVGGWGGRRLSAAWSAWVCGGGARAGVVWRARAGGRGGNGAPEDSRPAGEWEGMWETGGGGGGG